MRARVRLVERIEPDDVVCTWTRVDQRHDMTPGVVEMRLDADAIRRLRVVPEVLEVVQEVEAERRPSGSAVPAGARRPDILVEVDGQSKRLTESQWMTWLINARKVGDRIKVTALRDGKPLIFEADAGGREALAGQEPRVLGGEIVRVEGGALVDDVHAVHQHDLSPRVGDPLPRPLQRPGHRVGGHRSRGREQPRGEKRGAGSETPKQLDRSHRDHRSAQYALAGSCAAPMCSVACSGRSLRAELSPT